MPSNPVVLVVDDEASQRDIASEFLRSNGFECLLATNGEEALEQMRLSPADVVVLDTMMPKKDGVETLREIKKCWPGTPVLMMWEGARGTTPLLGAARSDGLLSGATLDDATGWLAVIAARGVVSASGSWDEAGDPLVPSSHAISSSKSSDAPAAT